MRRLLPAALVAALVGISSPAAAHPSPFSYVDVRLQGSELRVAVVAHVYDVAHDLGVEPVERLLDPTMLRDYDDRIRKLVTDRLALTADGSPVAVEGWSAPESLAERQSVRLEGRATLARARGKLAPQRMGAGRMAHSARATSSWKLNHTLRESATLMGQ